MPVGTSLTSGGLVAATLQPRGWYCDVFGIGGAMFIGGTSRVTGTVTAGAMMPASLSPPIALHRPTLAEIGGAKLADNIASWSTLVTPYLPVDGYILEGNINDVNAATNQATFRTQVQTIIGLTGSKPFIWMGAWLGYIPNGENSTLFGDAFNLSIESYNTIIAQEVAAAGSRGTYFDVRTPTKAIMPTINPGNLGSGILTLDGVHPNEQGLGYIRKFAASSVTWT
jgi:hypothetical protein